MNVHPLVMLPGLDGSGTLFNNFRSYLQYESTLVIAYPPDEPLGYDDLIRFVESRLPRSPFTVLAESFSGPIAVKLAERHAQRCRAVILSTSFAKRPLGVWNTIARFTPVCEPHRFSGIRDHLLLGEWCTAALSASLTRALEPLQKTAFAVRMNAALSIDVCANVRRLTTPLLILNADHDRLLGRSAFRQLCQLRPDAVTRTLPGPHLLLQANPEGSATVIREWLRALS